MSSIDLVCNGCAGGRNINIEYKSGPGSIKSETIKKQFIERDLFNANSLDEIQWRMKNTNFDAEKLKLWLKENKSSLNLLLNDAAKKSKMKNWFNLSDFDTQISDINIDNFVNSSYNTIFR